MHKNIKNIPGLTIFGNQQMLNQVGSRSVKSATDDKSKSDKWQFIWMIFLEK